MSTLSRRDFIARTTLAVSASAFCVPQLVAAPDAKKFPPPILAFSKVYQELKLDFDAAADLTAEAGLAGVDSPVRPKGEILPEHAADELPRYVEALRKRNLTMPYISSGIVGVDTPHTEPLLRTAKKLGIGFYRLGFWNVDPAQAREKQLAEVKAKLKDIAAMNKELGICAIFQNHSPTGNRPYIGGDLGDLQKLVTDLNPAQVGIAFDFGHALIVHGDKWRAHFEKIKSHIQVAYIKDADRVKRFVKFGEGEYAKSGYFTLLKKMGYARPFSMHIEYPWAPKGQPKTRALLLEALKQSAACIKRWASEA